MAKRPESGRRRLLWRPSVAAVLAVLIGYVGSYAYLSRRGMAEAEAVGFPYFFYCPVADLVPGEDLPSQHRVCLVAFDPLERLDRRLFGGGGPCRCVLWGLSR